MDTNLDQSFKVCSIAKAEDIPKVYSSQEYIPWLFRTALWEPRHVTYSPPDNFIRPHRLQSSLWVWARLCLSYVATEPLLLPSLVSSFSLPQILATRHKYTTCQTSSWCQCLLLESPICENFHIRFLNTNKETNIQKPLVLSIQFTILQCPLLLYEFSAIRFPKART